MDWSKPGFPVHHQLPESIQIHVHRVSDAIQPSHPISSHSPPTFNLSQHQGFFQWVSSLYQPFQWILRLLSFRMDWLDFLAVQGTLRSLPQTYGSKAPVLRRSTFFIVQLSHPYMTTGKTIALTRWTFVGKVMSLLFSILSKLVIAFLLRIVQAYFNFMAAVTMCSDFGAQINKVCHCFHCFPICLPWSDGTGCHDLSFLNVEL